jgi:hypothetical protein
LFDRLGCGRWLAPSPPFTAERRALRLDIGAVDRRALRYRSSSCQRLQKLDPEPATRPSIETIIDSRVRTILCWAITPGTAALQDMEDPYLGVLQRRVENEEPSTHVGWGRWMWIDGFDGLISVSALGGPSAVRFDHRSWLEAKLSQYDTNRARARFGIYLYVLTVHVGSCVLA